LRIHLVLLRVSPDYALFGERMSIELRGMFETAQATAVAPLPADLSGYCRIIGDLRRASVAEDLAAEEREAATILADRMAQRVLSEIRERFSFGRPRSGSKVRPPSGSPHAC